MLQLREAITHELSGRNHTVTWLEDETARGWALNTLTYSEDEDGYITGQLSPGQIIETLYIVPKQGREVLEFVMMLHALSEECVKRKLPSTEPVFILYYEVLNK